MDENNKYTVDDLIASAIEQKPTEFEDTFNSLVLDRVQSAVEAKKQEIATSMFNNSIEVEAPEEE